MFPGSYVKVMPYQPPDTKEFWLSLEDQRTWQLLEEEEGTDAAQSPVVVAPAHVSFGRSETVLGGQRVMQPQGWANAGAAGLDEFGLETLLMQGMAPPPDYDLESEGEEEENGHTDERHADPAPQVQPSSSEEEEEEETEEEEDEGSGLSLMHPSYRRPPSSGVTRASHTAPAVPVIPPADYDADEGLVPPLSSWGVAALTPSQKAAEEADGSDPRVAFLQELAVRRGT